MQEKGFTLLELVAVIVIIGILAALGWTYFGPVKEKFLDKEAIVSLKLIQVAEKIYKLEYKTYWPKKDEPNANTSNINTNLRLDLPETNPNWTYETNDAGTGTADRVTDGRGWILEIDKPEPLEK